MTSRLRSTGFAALAFTLSAAVIGTTLAPAASAQVTSKVSITAPADGEALSQRVSVRDLDLAQPRDMKRLDARIRGASRYVCAPLTIGRMSRAEEDCRKMAVRSTDRQVALLRERALRLAAAGLPSRIDTTFAVVAPDPE